jgi:hypothetical protein
MPIEIIPRKKVRIPLWQILLFFLSLIFFLLAISAYFFLIRSAENYRAKIEEIKTDIGKEKTEEIEKIEEKISLLDKKLKIFSKILKEHIFTYNFFDLLEKTTHPKVMYNSLDLNPEKATLALSGQTENFLTLGQQILLLEESQFISELKLSKVSITKEGKVGFSFDISLKPEIFKWKE